MKVQPVILCGGSGTRLWPLSRADFPKQYIEYSKDALGVHSLFKSAINRLKPKTIAADVASPIIVAGKAHKFIVESQLSDEDAIQDRKLLLEPSGKNTATSVTIAALSCLSDDPVMVILPADQAIDTLKFRETIIDALPEAQKGAIILLGIKPYKPATGYGYIQTSSQSHEKIKRVKSFHEKPNLLQAKEYIANGNFLWNAGIFILKASTWINCLKACRPDIYDACLRAENESINDQSSKTYNDNSWSMIPSESVDYAVLEKWQAIGQPIYVIPFSGLWTDLGSWDAVHELLAHNDDRLFCSGDVLLKDSKNSLVISNSRLVVCNNIDNLAIVETPDSILVTKLDRSQEIKTIVQSLRNKNKTEATTNRKVYRPWGYFDSLDEGPGFKVKRIVVNPQQKLSLQLHHHRAEHWIITSGKATVQIGDSIQNLFSNQSIFIPQGVVHRLSNNTDVPLYVIEVQTGSYLGEDDIVRLQDEYGRDTN